MPSGPGVKRKDESDSEWDERRERMEKANAAAKAEKRREDEAKAEVQQIEIQRPD